MEIELSCFVIKEYGCPQRKKPSLSLPAKYPHWTTPLTLEYVFNGQPLIISVMQFFHRPDSVCGDALGSGAEGDGFKSNTELPTARHRCDFSSKEAELPECFVAAKGQANSFHVWA